MIFQGLTNFLLMYEGHLIFYVSWRSCTPAKHLFSARKKEKKKNEKSAAH